MFFEQENIAFEIVNVFFFDQYNIKTHNTNRKFDALGLRLESDVVIDTGDAQVELGTGALAFVPANLDYDRIAGRDKMLVMDFKSLTPTGNEIEYFYPSDVRKYKVLFERVYKIWSEKKTGYRYMASAVFNEILAEAHREKTMSAYSESKLYPALKYIDENCLKNDFSLSNAVAVAYMSDVYFRRLFKKEFGTSPKKYVIKKRMDYAESLMKSGYYSLKEVAYMCGYTDYKYFSVEFKKAVGVSPSEYK